MMQPAEVLEVVALLEVARLRAWLRAVSAIAGPDAVALAERAIDGELWPAGADELDGHGARRTGGLYDV